MFDLDRFVADCRAALAEDKGGHRGVREVVARAVASRARSSGRSANPPARVCRRSTTRPTSPSCISSGARG